MASDSAAPPRQRDIAAVTEQTAASEQSGRRSWRGRRRSDAPDTTAQERAQREAAEVVAAYDRATEALRASLSRLASIKRPRLLGKAEQELSQVARAEEQLSDARAALDAGDIAACGAAVRQAHRELSMVGGRLSSALQEELSQALVTRDQKAALQANIERRREAQAEVEAAGSRSARAGHLAAVPLYLVMAEGLSLAADALGDVAPVSQSRRPRADDEVPVLAPHELETFEDVGGLDDVVERLRRTVGLRLERSGDASRAGVAHNGILLYGPPGTGKTLMARAVAGEYGLRFLRFSPALIASAYQHEPAKRLRQLFALAAESAPCLFFIDEVDAIGGRRENLPGADQRELVTQLLNSLEEYRDVPGLVIMAATNAVDHLDPALREGRFDSRIAVPLPDAGARRDILEVLLAKRGEEVDHESLDLAVVVDATSGRSGAVLAAIVSGAAERALMDGSPLSQDHLMAEIEGRSGQDRAQTFEEQVRWDEVVLPEAARERLEEVLMAFQRPELARRLGVRPPAGILLHGPPGTGKTTIAKALATEVKASFYEQSAADLLSKWVGESEQKIAQLFARARANRPSIIFCDEIDALLRRRSGDSVAGWEQRVVTQFLRELDGLNGSEGVLLVGSTNRVDVIDEAVRTRRLQPIEIPLPDEPGRLRMLEVLCRDVRLAPDVDLPSLAVVTEGVSGADLKSIRDAAGMKALRRATRQAESEEPAVTASDFADALAERGINQLAPAPKKPAGGSRRRRGGTPRS